MELDHMLTSSKELTVLVRGCDFDAMTFQQQEPRDPGTPEEY